MSAVIELTRELVRRESVTPADAGCQALIAARLAALGFRIEEMPVGQVSNLWARLGDEAPVLCLAGHTDVVPAGPLEHWETPPFEPTVRDGYLAGRGAADMKGSLAAMVCAVERFLGSRPALRGSLAFLLTSDEEGPAVDGTRAVIDTLQARGEGIDYCLIGEPSGLAQTGDRIRVGRRGSLNAVLTVRGSQGHVAYPEEAINPIHLSSPALAELSAHAWDQGTAEFPPTSLQFTDLHAGVGATNVTPASLIAHFNLRYAPTLTASQIEKRLRAILDKHDLDYTLECTLSGEPFLTVGPELLEAVSAAIAEVTGLAPECSTGGGTSDGRFISPTGAQVIELGPPGATLHQVNEHVRLADLQRLEEIYHSILQRMLT